MIWAILIGAPIVLGISIAYLALVDPATGRITTHATLATASYQNFPNGGTSAMKPKDLLQYLEAGDRTMEDLGKKSGPKSQDIGIDHEAVQWHALQMYAQGIGQGHLVARGSTLYEQR